MGRILTDCWVQLLSASTNSEVGGNHFNGGKVPLLFPTGKNPAIIFRTTRHNKTYLYIQHCHHMVFLIDCTIRKIVYYSIPSLIYEINISCSHQEDFHDFIFTKSTKLYLEVSTRHWSCGKFTILFSQLSPQCMKCTRNKEWICFCYRRSWLTCVISFSGPLYLPTTASSFQLYKTTFCIG